MRPQPHLALSASIMGGRVAERGPTPARVATSAPVGFWLSRDGSVRLEIKNDGTYDGQVAGRKRRARGTYHVDGATMTLSDHDSGLHTPVVLHDGELEMAGHRLHR